ncbi:MAG: hypothetical protein JKX97_06245 [Candidatus Lindowbacteria bacterium]|nr:hypothetical protein [Candidatus Lindowbacteria bacterium]
MKPDFRDTPRVFRGGHANQIEIKDMGKILLEPDELLTFMADDDAEYDVTRKDWGFYATPSINGRLQSFGWRTALVKNSLGRIFVMIVQTGKEDLFEKYIDEEDEVVLCWMDDPEFIEKISQLKL